MTDTASRRAARTGGDPRVRNTAPQYQAGMAPVGANGFRLVYREMRPQ
jgi:hypothetical protein